MKEIKLTKGQVALVDDEDYEYVNQYKWIAYKSHNTFYAQTGIPYNNKNRIQRNTTISMHRFIMGNPINMEIDHINHNGLDNKKENLRIVTPRENCLNKIIKNKSGFQGVHKLNDKYYSKIGVKNNPIYCGLFDTAEEASKMYHYISRLFIDKNYLE